MPFDAEGIEPGIGLAVSGGGFRATLFHVGSFWRLNELGYLPKLSRLSSISGGSITVGLLGLRWNQLQFSADGASNFQQLLVEPLRAFCARDVDVRAVGLGALSPRRSASDVVEHAYQDHLFGKADLQSLPANPRIVINSTNFATGVSFRFSKPYAGDYRIGLIQNPTFRLSQAVAASSAFPPVLSPVIIDLDPAKFTRTDGADLYDQEEYRKRLVLTDGGVYDNLGLETIWNRYDTVLISDAGAPFEFSAAVDTSWHKQALRAMDIATNQSRALRKRAVIADLQQKVRRGAYWGIMTEVTRYNLADVLPCPSSKTQMLAAMRTRLNHFNEQEQCELINWGYAVCDAAMRRWLSSNEPGATPTPDPRWPYPQYALDRN